MSDVRERVSTLTLEERLALERQLLAGLTSTATEPQPRRGEGPAPLNFAQESLWLFSQLHPSSPAYYMPQAFRLRGELDVPALQESLKAVAQRQSALRTRFMPADGNAQQVTHETTVELPLTDLSRLDDAPREAESRRLLDEEIRRPFRLDSELPIRARLIRLHSSEHILLLVVHHIVADFTSLHILHEELTQAYQQVSAGKDLSLPPLPVTLAELAVQERARVEGADLKGDYEYWLSCFNSAPAPLTWPIDHPPPEPRNFVGDRIFLRLSSELSGRLHELSRQEGVTLNVLLLAAFKTLLHRYTGQEDIVVGTPIERRHAAGSEQVIGLLVNTLPMRTDLSGDPTFRALLKRTSQVVSGALAHQSVPIEKLLESRKISRRQGANSLYQAVFQYLPAEWPRPRLDRVVADLIDVHTGTAKFDLTLTFFQDGRELLGELEYDAELFDSDRIKRMAGHLEVLLQSAAANLDQPLSQLPLLTPDERRQLINQWNGPADCDYPRDRSVHELFEEQAHQNPQAIALVSGDSHVSYGELNAQANQLARYLQEQGIEPGQPVGVCLERSASLITVLLAILKAGGCYVPFDPTYPAERLDFMLRDSGVSLVITTSELPLRRPGAHATIFTDRMEGQLANKSTANLPSRTAATDLAYILYTSGSTGQPKGVAIPHRGIVRLVKNSNYARFAPEEVFLQFAPISFDASTFEIWGALLNGAKLVLYPPSFDSLEQFGQVLSRHGVTTLWLTAGLFQQVVDQQIEALRGVRQLLAGGDVLSVPHVRKVLEQLPDCQLINGYGPTENTTFSCCYRFPRDWKGQGTAPIGQPIAQTQAFILDRHLEPVPFGVVGELFLGGDGLAREYWRNPELTASKLVPNPFRADPESRLYRTGDQVRYRADGTIEFLGRLDDQVKINGFRIHLSEVEAALLELPEVAQAAVATQVEESGAKSLVAYVVPKSGLELKAQTLRDELGQKLPTFMLPSYFVILDKLPLTPNGKLDRRALPPPSSRNVVGPKAAAAPENPVQEKVLSIWKEVFGRQEIGVDDNFFDLGGHSLVATRVISRVNQAFNANLSLATLFRAPTVRALSEKLGASAEPAEARPIKRRARA